MATTAPTVSTALRVCPICMAPATHSVRSDGWDGIGCQRHAEHVATVDPSAIVTPL